MGQVRIEFDSKKLHAEVPELVDIEHHCGEASCVEGSDELVLLFANGKQIAVWFDTDRGCLVVEAD